MFDKHVRYLQNTIFGKSDYDANAFAEAVETCRSDINRGVDHLYQVLRSVISQFHNKEPNKAERLAAQAVDMTDLGNGVVEVASEGGVREHVSESSTCRALWTPSAQESE